MKIPCDEVLTIENFNEKYSMWQNRSLTIMGEQIKVSQDGLTPKYFDAVYLFEGNGIMIGFSYSNDLPSCTITTSDGLELNDIVDASPYLFDDMGKIYAVVKKEYRNVDRRKSVIGLNLVAIPTLEPVYKKKTWPLWESIELIENGAVVIKKGEGNYAISSIDKFPSCNILDRASYIEQTTFPNIYLIKKDKSADLVTINISKKLSKINNR